MRKLLLLMLVSSIGFANDPVCYKYVTSQLFSVVIMHHVVIDKLKSNNSTVLVKYNVNGNKEFYTIEIWHNRLAAYGDEVVSCDKVAFPEFGTDLAECLTSNECKDSLYEALEFPYELLKGDIVRE